MTDSLREQLALLSPGVDVPAGHALLRRRIDARRRQRRWLAGGLAVATGGAMVAGLLALTGRDSSERITSTPPSSETTAVATTAGETTTTSPQLPGYTVVGTSDQNIGELGSLSAAGNGSQLAEMWSRYHVPGPAPVVDFSSHIALAMTIADSGCPASLVAIDHTEPNTFTPVFEEQPAQTEPTAECPGALVGRTFIVTAEKSVIGEQFTLRLPEAEGYYRDQVLDAIVTPGGIMPADRTTDSSAAGFQDAAERSIRASFGDGSQAQCALPSSTDVGTRFGCTGAAQGGPTMEFVAEIDKPNQVTVGEAQPDGPSSSSAD